MITDRQMAVAGMLGRGYSMRHVAVALGVAKSTIARWKQDPLFVAEVERARATRLAPTPRGTLLDALSARRDDGIDWPSRVRAALALLELDEEDEDPNADVVAGWVA